MKEVSTRTSSQLLDGAEFLGFDAEEIAATAGYSTEALRTPGGWVSWETVVALTATLEQRGVTLEQFEQLGRQMIHFPSSKFLRRLAGKVVRLRQLYTIMARWLAPSLFPVIRTHLATPSPTTTVLRLEIPDGYAGCEPFFRIVSGVTRVVPELVDDGEAEVTAEVSPRACTLRVELPVEESMPLRMVRTVQETLFPSGLLTELSDHQERLRGSYEDLFRSRQELTQVLERVPAGIAVCRNGSVLYANPELARILDHADAGELLGLPFGDLLNHGRADLPLPDCIESAALREPVEVRLRKADQSSAAAEITGGGQILFDGAPAQVLMIRDVSVQRALEEDLRRSDRLASLGRIAANVAHEVNNPLGYMTLNLQRLRRRWTKAQWPDEDDELRSLDAIEDGAKHIGEIVKELTGLAPREGEHAVPIDAQTVIDEAVDMAAGQLSERAAVQRDYRAHAFVTAQPRHLQQVILNLLNNAAQALPRSASHLGRIVVRTFDGPDSKVFIEVEDNGEGIADEHRHRIFKPFFSTKSPGENTGLGLTISQDLLARMAGQLTFETIAGKGTVFRIELPAEPDQATTRPRRPGASGGQTPTNGKRALAKQR